MRMLFDGDDPFGTADVQPGSDDASAIGAYFHAVGDFLAADPSDPNYGEVIENLHQFDNFEIDGQFALTDEDYLEELAAEGELAFDDLYEEW